MKNCMKKITLSQIALQEDYSKVYKRLCSIFARTSEVHRQTATFELLVVEHIDSLLSTSLISHVYESKTTTTTSLALCDDAYIGYFTGGGKESTNSFDSSAIWESSNVQTYRFHNVNIYINYTRFSTEHSMAA